MFEKLDADGDGRVSFREFLNELFQHNTPATAQPPVTPRSKGTTPTRPSSTPTRAQSAQKKIKFPGSEDRITPSFVQGKGVTGLFSAIDLNRTGYEYDLIFSLSVLKKKSSYCHCCHPL